jgi:hypothetical protein
MSSCAEDSSEIQPVSKPVVSEIENDGTVRFIVDRISIDILSTTRLDDQRVAQEVGKQYPSWRATKKELEDYGTALESLKKDLKKFAANQYSKICLKKAAVLQMKTKENCIVTNWTTIGTDFALSPTWSKAITLFHTLYTSMDECPEFKINVEQEWMKNNGIVYTEECPQGTRERTGICSMITHKVCGLRKDINKRVSKKHGFYVIKSKPKNTDGKQARRRKVYLFEQEYVVYDPKIGSKQPVTDFDTYIKSLNGDTYVSFQESMSLFEIKQSNAVLPKRVQDNLEFQERVENVVIDRNNSSNDVDIATISTENAMTPVITNTTKLQTTPKKLQGREQKYLEKSMKELEEQQRKFNEMKIKFEKEMAAKQAGLMRAIRVKKRKVNNLLLTNSTFFSKTLTSIVNVHLRNKHQETPQESEQESDQESDQESEYGKIKKKKKNEKTIRKKKKVSRIIEYL